MATRIYASEDYTNDGELRYRYYIFTQSWYTFLQAVSGLARIIFMKPPGW